MVTFSTSQTSLEQRLEKIAPMLYQLHGCRNWLHSKRCHNCTNTGLPNPIIQPRHAPGYTHSKLLMKSMFSNQVVITGEPPASEDLPQHHGRASKVRKQRKGQTSPREWGTNIFKIHCFSGLVVLFSPAGLIAAQSSPSVMLSCHGDVAA